MSAVPIGWGVADLATVGQKVRSRCAQEAVDKRMRPARIAYWLGARRTVPTVEQIIDTWHVSRAHAYRWRKFALSHGQEFPATHKDEGDA